MYYTNMQCDVKTDFSSILKSFKGCFYRLYNICQDINYIKSCLFKFLVTMAWSVTYNKIVILYGDV